MVMHRAMFAACMLVSGLAEAAPPSALRGRALSTCVQHWLQCTSPRVPVTESCCAGYTCKVYNDWWASCQPLAPSANPTYAPSPAPTPNPIFAPSLSPSQVVPSADPNPTKSKSGVMSMWSTDPEAMKTGKCEYASDLNLDGSLGNGEGMNSPAAQSKYIMARHYVAVSDFASDPLWRGGKACGNCYRLSKSNGENPLVVQVVDQMVRTDRTFDSQLTAFQAITGDTTDVYDVKYEQVDCETKVDSGIYTVYHGPSIDNKKLWWTAVIFYNLNTGVDNAVMLVGNSDQARPMTRNGARFDSTSFVDIGGALKPIKFQLTLNNGTVMIVDASSDPAYDSVDSA